MTLSENENTGAYDNLLTFQNCQVGGLCFVQKGLYSVSKRMLKSHCLEGSKPTSHQTS